MGQLVLRINVEDVQVIDLELLVDLEREGSTGKEESNIEAHSIEPKGIHPAFIIVEGNCASFTKHEKDDKGDKEGKGTSKV